MSEEEIKLAVGAKISFQREKKKDGTNWVIFVGGTIATGLVWSLEQRSS